METIEAVLAVLRDEAAPLHWTKIQDLALRRGFIDPFDVKDVRRTVLGTLAEAARDGAVVRHGKGMYSLPED